MKTTLATLALASILTAGTAVGVMAQSESMEHGGHGMQMETMGGTAADTDDPVIQANRAAMETMHEDMMAIEYTGNADIDFARGMIPHHQAAIDMAEIELEHGTNEDMRALAEEIIAAQKAEIERLEALLESAEAE